jgi:hypothetical protein
LLAGLSAAFLMTGIAGQAQANSYAFSSLQLSGYSYTGAATVGTSTIGLNNVAIQTGVPNGSANTLDGSQAYVGPAGTAPSENTFTAKGTVNPDYVRSDSQATATVPSSGVTNTVAEGFLTTGGGQSSGTTSIQISTPFTTTGTSSTVVLSFSATSQLAATVTAPVPATAQANFTYNYTIKDSLGNIVFNSTSQTVPNGLVNQSVSQTTLGSSTVPLTTTPVTFTATGLGAGSYTATITQTSVVFLTQAAAIPEPSSLLMGGMAFGLLGGVFGWRHRKSSRTA